MRCWWPWPLTGTAERQGGWAGGGRGEARGSLRCPPAHSRSRPPPPPLAPLQTTTSLSKSTYSVLRCPEDPVLLFRPLLSLLPSDLRAGTTTRPLEGAAGPAGGPPHSCHPTCHRRPGSSGLHLSSFRPSVSPLVPGFSLPAPSWPSSPFTPFSSSKSHVQFTRTAFSCPKQKGKGEEERNFRLLVRLQKRKRATPKPQGKRKTQFLRKRT